MIDIQKQKYSAIILAAGQGSRLGYKHKALIKIKNRTLLSYWIEKLITINIDQIIITDLKERIQNTKNIINQQYKNYLNNIQYVQFNQAPGPGLTLMKALQYVKNQKVFLISCDTFSNIPISDLDFNKQNYSGKMLLSLDNKGYFTIIKQSQDLIQQAQQNSKNRYVYTGISCLKTKDLKLCCDHPQNSNKQYTNLKEIFLRLIKKYNILYIQFNEYKFYFENINTQQDYQRVSKMIQN